MSAGPLRSTEKTSGGSENVHWRAAPSSGSEKVQRLHEMPIPSQPSRVPASNAYRCASRVVSTWATAGAVTAASAPSAMM